MLKEIVFGFIAGAMIVFGIVGLICFVTWGVPTAMGWRLSIAVWIMVSFSCMDKDAVLGK